MPCLRRYHRDSLTSHAACLTMPDYSPVKNPIGARLKLEMKKRDIASAELARRAGVLTSFLYDIISGKSANPSTVKLARVADALGVNLTYLVGGTDSSAEAPLHKDYVGVAHLGVVSGSVITREDEQAPCHFRKQWLQERFGATAGALRVLRIDGDSMQPTLCHQDMVLVDTGKTTPTPPGIFVLFDGMGLLVKRLDYVQTQHTPRIRIMSDNPRYTAYERDIADTSIIGRVVWFSRDI